MTPDERNAAIVAIANQYATSQDVEAAKLALSELGLPNAGQSVLALAEAQIAGNADPETTVNLVSLAQALGPVSRMAQDYLARQAAPAAAPAEVAAAAPADTPAPTETPTPVPPTNTPEPTPVPTDTPEPTATDTPAPVPLVVANSQANVRSGPGTAYSVVGSMSAGNEAEVLGRNASGNWWQIVLADGTEGWVAGSLVTASGPVDAVAVAQNIAPPPATPTSPPTPVAQQPTEPPPAAAPAPTQPPRSGVDFRIVKTRMLTIDENGSCMGNHNAFVKVIDANGNPLNGVLALAIWQTQTARDEGKPDVVALSGSKGSDFRGSPDGGWLQFDMYSSGEQIVIIRDTDGREVTSETTRSLEVQDEKIGPELLLASGYCSSLEDCQERINQNRLCRGHYSWEVIFQRTY